MGSTELEDVISDKVPDKGLSCQLKVDPHALKSTKKKAWLPSFYKKVEVVGWGEKVDVAQTMYTHVKMINGEKKNKCRSTVRTLV
jgi:hypothetical protein